MSRLKVLAPLTLALAFMFLFPLVWLGAEYPDTDGETLKTAPGTLVYLRKLFYSPGELSLQHISLDCADCHIPFRRIDDTKCKVCHSAEKLALGSGLTVRDAHIAMLESEAVAELPNLCLLCHKEHRGVGINITQPLKHAGHDPYFTETISCVNCHRSDSIHHINMLNDNCGQCHQTNNWASPFSHKDLPELQSFLDNRDITALNRTVCASCHDYGWHLGSVRENGVAGSGFECFVCHESLFKE